MGPGQLPPTFPWPCGSRASLIQRHSLEAGTLSPPMQAPLPQGPGLQLPWSQKFSQARNWGVGLATRIEQVKSRVWKLKCSQASGLLDMQCCQRLKLLSLLQRTGQSLISLFLVAMISLLCYSGLLSLHQHLLFARGAAYQGCCSPPKDSAYRFCFPTLGEQSDG